ASSSSSIVLNEFSNAVNASDSRNSCCTSNDFSSILDIKLKHLHLYIHPNHYNKLEFICILIQCFLYCICHIFCYYIFSKFFCSQQSRSYCCFFKRCIFIECFFSNFSCIFITYMWIKCSH